MPEKKLNLKNESSGTLLLKKKECSNEQKSAELENKKGGYNISQNEKWQNKTRKFDEINLPVPFIFRNEM